IVEMVEIALESDDESTLRGALSDEIEEMLERSTQTKDVKARGPQATDQRPHSFLDMVAVLDNRGCGPMNRSIDAQRATLDGHCVRFDCIQVLAQLIVQLACERLALRLLQLHVLLSQAPMIVQQRGKLCLRCTSGNELPARFHVSTPSEPSHANGENEQGSWQLVKLKVLPSSCLDEQRLAQLHVGEHERGHHSDQGHDCGIAPRKWDTRVLRLGVTLCHA